MNTWKVDLNAPPYVGSITGLIAIVDVSTTPPRAIAFVAPSLKAEAQLMGSAKGLLTVCAVAVDQLEVAADDAEECGYDQRAENIRIQVHHMKNAIAKATETPE